MAVNKTYKAKQFNLSGLTGNSDQTLEVHFKLYEGYVANTNTLNEKISQLSEKGPVGTDAMPVFSELTRRLGFEYNGMVLHEYYFGNMKKGGNVDPEKNSNFYRAAEKSYGSYENWKNEFVSVGKIRGVGWAICYQDPTTGYLSNHWINLHEEGNVAGYKPIVVLDAWEHAFLLDYKPADRPKYIEAFFSNMDWNAIEKRLITGTSQSTTA
jgi:Fe-Mn family superoxide dismutase